MQDLIRHLKRREETTSLLELQAWADEASDLCDIAADSGYIQTAGDELDDLSHDLAFNTASLRSTLTKFEREEGRR